LTVEQLAALVEQTAAAMTFMWPDGKPRIPDDLDFEPVSAPEGYAQNAFFCGMCHSVIEPLRFHLQELPAEFGTPEIRNTAAEATAALDKLMQRITVYGEEVPAKLILGLPPIIESLLASLDNAREVEPRNQPTGRDEALAG
jgi:hypothetical protein